VEGLIAILTDLSQVLGFPAAICLAWAAFVLRDHGKRISELENSQKSEVNAIYDRLNDIAQDVAYIKGRMEGDN
jgi:hypothetical protein